MKKSPFCRSLRSLLAGSIAVAASLTAVEAADGTWNLNANGNWSTAGNWLGSVIADGAGFTGDFSQFNINNNRTVTIDTTSRTLGTLTIGDFDGTHNYSIAASGGAALTFDNSGSSALLSQVNGANTISAPIILADNLNITNNSVGTLTLSTGGITGPRSIGNVGIGSGATTISGVVGADVTGVVQDSASSQLNLTGANLFTSGVNILQGTLRAGNNLALGTNTATLGAGVGSANAGLLIGSFTIANTILVQAGSSGNTLTIGGDGNSAARSTGSIILDNDVVLSVTGGGQSGRNTGAYLNTSGTIGGTGDLTLDVDGALATTNNTNSPQMDSLSVSGPVTTIGAINNTGTGSGRAIISGDINNASALNQNSATSMLSLSGNNTYSGTTSVNAGVLRVTTNSALSANSTVTVASGATLQLQNGATALNASQVVNISGFGTSYSFGAIESVNNANHAGSIVLLDDAAVSSDLANTTLTLSGTISGSGNTLTAAGAGTVAISGGIATGSGGLTKMGSGVLNLSGANTFTGLTTLSQGAVLLSSADALGGGGSITFDGGALRHSASNELNLGSRIVNSTGPVSVDTNSRNVTYSNIAASNTGGLTKLGAGRLTLDGTNAFSGVVAVNGGVLAVANAGAIPSVGSSQIFLDANGALDSGGAYADVQAWLDSDNIATSSTGAIALTANSSENMDFTGFNGLSLGASANVTYTGVLTAAGGTYRLGGGGGTLSLSGADALTGANDLVVSAGNVTLTGANDLSGDTTVSSNTLTLSGGAGGLASSDIAVGSGATLALISNTAATPVTRASSVTLNRGTMAVTGNSTANSTDAITNALTVGAGGSSTVTLTQSNARNVLLSADSLDREAGGTALVRGTNLGVNSIASTTANSTNIEIANPVLVGGTGVNTTDGGIFLGLVGDTSASGTGFGSTGGLLTYDATNGVRLLSGAEYKTSITDGQTQLDNVRLSKATAGAQNFTMNANSTINSLSINATGNASAAVQLGGTGTLTLNSGMIYYGSVTANVVSSISNAIDFNGEEGVILAGGSGALNLSGVLANTGGNGVTVGGNRTVTFSGASANTYTGTTTVNGGTLELNKTAGVDAVTGDLLVNGATVTLAAANQIADGSDVTLNGGIINYRNETISDLSIGGGGIVRSASSNGIVFNVNGNASVSGGSTFSSAVGGQINVAGSLSLGNGGNLVIQRSQSVLGVYDGTSAVGGLSITNSNSGAYTAVTIDHGGGLGQSGGKLVLNGDVAFTGNATNSNTVLIDAITGSGRKGVVGLNGTRAFDIGNGAAKVDLRITGAIVEEAVGSGLTKDGGGTLDLTGENTYTGATTVNAGTLLINGTSASAVTVNGGILGGSGAIANSVSIGNGGTLAPGNSPGALSTGDLSLTGASATIAMEIAGTTSGQYDQVNVTGAVNLDGNGQIVLDLVSFTPAVNDIFFLILNDGTDAINGTLAGLTQGAIFTAEGYDWRVSYVGNSAGGTFTGGNDLALQVVPEPSTWLLLTGGLMAVTFLRRRRRA